MERQEIVAAIMQWQIIVQVQEAIEHHKLDKILIAAQLVW